MENGFLLYGGRMDRKTCEYCGGTGTFGPLTTFEKILEGYRAKKWSFEELNQVWIRLGSEMIFKRRCPVCLGDGCLDWIERIVGKRFENVERKY